jgi:hypothetical protein
MQHVNEIVRLLQKAIEDKDERAASILSFQAAIFENTQESVGAGSDQWEVFSDLAYDLDYFEPDPKARLEDPSYFGEERAVELILEALRRVTMI